MGSYFFGLDYGTGGAKGCIIDGEGKVLSYAFSEYPIINLKPGWSEHDPVLYWKIACQIISQCIEKAGIDPSKTFFVDDSKRNIEASRRSGFIGVLHQNWETTKLEILSNKPDLFKIK